MDERKAFQVFIRHELNFAIEEGKINLSETEISEVVKRMEDDIDFHERLADFLTDEIEIFW